MRKRKTANEITIDQRNPVPDSGKRGMISKIEEKTLQTLWPKAVGPQIALQTRRIL